MTKRISTEQAQADLLHRIRTEGIFAAYEASLAICRDKNAPAPARATASGTLFRVAGFFNKENTDAGDKQPHEMTPEELNREIQKIERLKVAPPDDDIFN